MVIDFEESQIPIPPSSLGMNPYTRNPSSGSESAFIGSWGSSSSSSFLNNSFESEFDSNETESDDDEFIAELTRRMTDYMLDTDEKPSSKDPGSRKPASQEPLRRSYADTVKNSIGVSPANQSFSDDQPPPPVQLYKVENQPRVGGWGRKGKVAESTQYSKPNRVGRGDGGEFVSGGKGFHGPSAPVGSGMRAIFLGGSGSRNGSSGTGVFLPRSPTDATNVSRKKPACSTVLIPTRVLKALEQHFNNIESVSPSNSLANARSNQNDDVNNIQDQSQPTTSLSMGYQEPKLPQEWIY